MSQRTKVVGTRTPMMWVLAILAVVLIAALALGALVFLPREQSRLAAREVAAQAEQHYEAGVAFQSVGDWEKALIEYEQVVTLNAGYKDAKSRLAEVKTLSVAAAATATSAIAARAKQDESEATAAAQAASTAVAGSLQIRYQHALGLINLGRWTEAQSELQAIFDESPNYEDVQSKLAQVNEEVAKLIPTETPTPVVTATPSSTPTPVIRSPSLRWLGFEGDQTSPSGTGSNPDGNSDGVFALVLPDPGRIVSNIVLRTPDSREHWDSDGQESWVLGVVDEASGRRVDSLGAPMSYSIDTVSRLKLYASVAGTGFRPGQEYIVKVSFADGYSLELPIKIP